MKNIKLVTVFCVAWSFAFNNVLEAVGPATEATAEEVASDPSNAGTNSTQTHRPNVLYIMSDDHTTQAVGAYGSRLAPLNPTPAIDRLAAEGIRFSNAICTNSICVPSRASVMTGQYSHKVGCHTLQGKLPAECQYLAHAMKAADYYSAIIGKWHLHDRPAAFDHYQVLIGQCEYFDPRFRVSGSDKVLNTGSSEETVGNRSMQKVF